MDKLLLSAKASPHIRTKTATHNIMLDVCIALLPAVGFGIYHFGWYVALVILVTVLSAVLSEYLYTKLLNRPLTITDGSAVVTGLLLALSLPPSIPLWMPVIGAIFAIVIVKCLFGGIGQNFLNPALAARALLLASWPAEMTTFIESRHATDAFTNVTAVSSSTAIVDAESVATPLAGLANNLADWPGDLGAFLDKLLGNSSGVIGEISILAILIGAVYLFVRRVIRLDVPVIFLASFAFFAWMFIGTTDQFFTGNPLAEMMFGGVMFVAVFMVTDYTTTPMTKRGRFIFAVGAGFLTAIIRRYSSYPEGVTYAILLMNLCVPLIDRLIVPKSFGKRRETRV